MRAGSVAAPRLDETVRFRIRRGRSTFDVGLTHKAGIQPHLEILLMQVALHLRKYDIFVPVFYHRRLALSASPKTIKTNIELLTTASYVKSGLVE